MTAADRYHPATFALQSVIAQSNTLERELARLLGLNATDYRALSVLHQLGRGATVPMGQLASALGTSPATTSAIVDRLERAGYAARHRDVADRRQITLEPTRLGWTRIIEIMRPLMADTDAYLKGLSPDQAQVVADFLLATAQQLTEHAETLSARESPA